MTYRILGTQTRICLQNPEVADPSGLFYYFFLYPSPSQGQPHPSYTKKSSKKRFCKIKNLQKTFFVKIKNFIKKVKIIQKPLISRRGIKGLKHLQKGIQAPLEPCFKPPRRVGFKRGIFGLSQLRYDRMTCLAHNPAEKSTCLSIFLLRVLFSVFPTFMTSKRSKTFVFCKNRFYRFSNFNVFSKLMT